MNYNAILAVRFIGIEGKSRTHFSASPHGLIGGIQFRLKGWKIGEYVTCFLVPPSAAFSFKAGDETVIPAKIIIPLDLKDTFQVDSEFELVEVAPVAMGKLLSIFPTVE